MTARSRRLLVTVGLSVAGAVFGALSVMVALGYFELMDTVGAGGFDSQRYRGLRPLEWIGAGIFFGGPLGAVLAPVTGWLVLRRAPLAAAFGGLTVGATFGGLFSFAVAALGGRWSWAVNPLSTALCGYFIAAAALRYKYSPTGPGK